MEDLKDTNAVTTAEPVDTVDADETTGDTPGTEAAAERPAPRGTAGQIGDLVDVMVRMLSVTAEPSTVRDYYLTLRRRGRGAPDAVGVVIDDFMEELRTAVAQEQPYNERHHRARLSLPPYVQMNESLLPRSALVRRIFRERVMERPVPRPR